MPFSWYNVFYEGGENVDKNKEELWMIHRDAIKDQGRKTAWVCRHLECSQSLIHKYVSGEMSMSQGKVDKLHSILELDEGMLVKKLKVNN